MLDEYCAARKVNTPLAFDKKVDKNLIASYCIDEAGYLRKKPSEVGWATGTRKPFFSRGRRFTVRQITTRTPAKIKFVFAV